MKKSNVGKAKGDGGEAAGEAASQASEAASQALRETQKEMKVRGGMIKAAAAKSPEPKLYSAPSVTRRATPPTGPPPSSHFPGVVGLSPASFARWMKVAADETPVVLPTKRPSGASSSSAGGMSDTADNSDTANASASKKSRPLFTKHGECLRTFFPELWEEGP